jgi:hypothetical protein
MIARLSLPFDARAARLTSQAIQYRMFDVAFMEQDVVSGLPCIPRPMYVGHLTGLCLDTALSPSIFWAVASIIHNHDPAPPGAWRNSTRICQEAERTLSFCTVKAQWYRILRPILRCAAT